MLARSWIAVLLLTNYLLVAGMGCMSRPEDQQEFVMVQTKVAGHEYQQCRYLRMDGLEDFLNEALATRYQTAPETPPHHLISVVHGVDAHCLPDTFYPTLTVIHHTARPVVTHQLVRSGDGFRVIDIPPRLG